MTTHEPPSRAKGKGWNSIDNKTNARGQATVKMLVRLVIVKPPRIRGTLFGGPYNKDPTI